MKNSTISGGYKNIANGDYSFAFGKEATTNIAKTAVFNWQGTGQKTVYIGTNSHAIGDYRLCVGGNALVEGNAKINSQLEVDGKVTINDVLKLVPRAGLPPTPHEVGDIYVDNSGATPKVKVCVTAGSPGTWETLQYE